MTCFLGQEPGKQGRAAGAPFGWICTNFGRCPPELGEDSEGVQQYARAYLWYVICRAIFPDAGGSIAPFMWLQLLAIWDSKWSWGTAALAYLYRQVTTRARFYTKFTFYLLFMMKPNVHCIYSRFCFCLCSWTRRAVGVRL